MDRISKLPLGIIETILCLLTIQEAARTSILSREWRYRWTKISKLVFSEGTFQVSTRRGELSVLEKTFDGPSERRKMPKKCKLFYAIFQVLLTHQGPIHDFTLSILADKSCVEIDHIILHLSNKKNTVKILKLDFGWAFQWCTLPISLFSFHQLTSLYLTCCSLLHESSLIEFGSLTTLYMERVQIYDKTLVRLLSSCPVLKTLTLDFTNKNIIYTGCSTISDLFEGLPVIESLSISFYTAPAFEPKRLPKVLPTTLVQLKYLCMKYMCFGDVFALPFLVLLIRSSPNLEKLKLESHVIEQFEQNIINDYYEEEDMDYIALEDYSDIMLEHLNELEIQNYYNTDSELDFVKLILAKSPVLKKVRIFLPDYRFDEDKKSQISENLLCSPCASPVVKFIF